MAGTYTHRSKHVSIIQKPVPTLNVLMCFQILSVLITPILLLLIIVYWKSIRPGKRIYNALRDQGVPGEPFVPILGQLPRLHKFRKQNRIMEFHEELCKKYGSAYVFCLGSYPRLVVQDPDLLADILSRANAPYYQKPLDLIHRFKPLIGTHNIFISNGYEHERARKMLNPGFHFDNLRSMVSTMTNQTAKTIEKLLCSFEKSIDLKKELSLLTLAIVAQSAFGETFETNDSAKDIMSEAFIAASEAIVNRTLLLIDQIPLFSQLPFWGKDVIDTGCQKALEFVERIIDDRKKGRTKQLCEGSDILDLLLNAVDNHGEHFTDEEIRQQAMSFVFAGHQSTGDLMTWIMYVFMTNPSVLCACREEVDRVLPNNMTPTYELLSELHICESVIYETMRLYPPVAFFVRQCVREHVIGSSDHQLYIPLNTTILINTYLLHRQEKYWPKPLEFDYTRWIRDPSTGLKPKLAHPYCYLPFSYGPRNCLGQNFALLEAKIILAMFVQRCNFELEPKDQNMVMDIRLTLQLKYGLFSRLTRRS